MSDNFPDGMDMAALYQQKAKARLEVFNPSPKRRQGIVVTDWQPIAKAAGVAPERLKLFAGRRRIHAQVDRIDPVDPSRDQLAFQVDQPLRTGDDYATPSTYVNVEEDDPEPHLAARADLYPTGAKLSNDRIEVWINTSVDRFGSPYLCFANAITSALLYRPDDRPFEMLDGIASAHRFLGHPDKRLQVDRVRLALAPWENDAVVEETLHDKPWRAIAKSEGTVRACVTLASMTFPYESTNPNGSKVAYEYTVYRVLSLNAGEDVVHEEMWVKGIGTDKKPVSLNFAPRYFMMTDLGPEPVTFRYPSVSGWFVIASEVQAHHGYGFASNVAAGALWTPPMDWPDNELKDRAFAWDLETSKRVRATHLFRFGRREQIADFAGWEWYQIYKPLTARVG